MELGATLCAPDGSGVDPLDPLAPFYRSTEIGRDVFRAHADGQLEGLLAGRHGEHECPVCAKGAVKFIQGLQLIAEGAADAEAAAAAVHATLPLPVPKKAKRQERLAVAALHREATLDAGTTWLLIKRPDGGLLAGQWEFPAAVVATHPSQETDDPGAQVRTEAVDALLASAGIEPGALQGRCVVALPVQHLFSHVRHVMHIEHACAPEGAEEAGAPWTQDGRTLCWATAEWMATVGVTAGVKKVIAQLVPTPKRKRKAKEYPGQQSLQSFFKS